MASIHKRVIKDITEGAKNLKQEFGIYLAPEENDFFKVHFVLPGPEETPFEGGLYHGMIRLNNEHPLKPPNIHMITPNGRFVAEPFPIPNGSRGICTTTSSFHPETWTPLNNIETVIKGFISLMCDKYEGGFGGINSTPQKIKELAKDSIEHIKSEPIKELFPELYQNLVNGTYKQVKLSELGKNKKDGIGKNKIQKKSTKKKIEYNSSDENEDSVKEIKKSINKKELKKVFSTNKAKNNKSKTKKNEDIIVVTDSEEDDSEYEDNSEEYISSDSSSEETPKKSKTKMKAKKKLQKKSNSKSKKKSSNR